MIAVRGVGPQTAVNTAAPVVTYPTTVANDALFLVCAYTTSPSVLTMATPTGWTQVGTFNLGVNSPLIYVYWKQANGTESGTTLTLAASGSVTWRCSITALSGVRTSGTPWAHTLADGDGSVAGSKVTAGSLPVDATTSRYVLAFVKTSSSACTFSVETLPGLTGVAGTEIADTGNGVLAWLGTASGGSTSVFGATFSTSAGWVYVLTDLVESVTAGVGASQTVTVTPTAGARANYHATASQTAAPVLAADAAVAGPPPPLGLSVDTWAGLGMAWSETTGTWDGGQTVLYHFTPPTVFDQPQTDLTSNPANRLMAHYRAGERGQSVWVTKAGQYTLTQPALWDDVDHVMYGGHEYVVDEAEALLLQAAGFVVGGRA